MTNSYFSALENILRPTLKILIQRNYMTSSAAKSIYSSRRKWARDFIQRLPGNVSKSQFQQLLAKYILVLYKKHFSNNDDLFGGFGGSGGGGFGGDMFSSLSTDTDIFGSPSNEDVFGSSGGSGGFSVGFETAGAPSDNLSGGDIFGSDEHHSDSMNKKEEEDSVQYTRYVPDWYKGDTLAVRNFVNVDVSLKEHLIPSTDVEGPCSYYQLSIPKAFKSHKEILTYISDAFTHGNFVAQVTYDKVVNVKGRKATVEEFVKTMLATIEKHQDAVAAIQAISSQFDDCSRGIYDGFSEILISLFNRYVRASALFNSKAACDYHVEVGSLNGITMMLNGPSDPRISKVVGGVANYDEAIQKVCVAILNVLKTIRVSEDPQHIATAMANTNSGIDGGKYVVLAERSDTTILEEIKESNVAVVYTDTTGVSNLDYRSSFSIAKSLLSESKGVALTDDVITSNLDAIIIKFYTNKPVEIVFDDGTIVGYGLSTNNKRIIRAIAP